MVGELTVREILAFGLGGLVALAAFNTGVAQARMVPSGSMAPTFLAGDRLLVVPHPAPVHRGEVVVFKPAFGQIPGSVQDDSPYVKRCVALAGDTVEVRAGQGLLEPLARDAVDTVFGRARDDFVAALAQNGDSLRADQPGTADDDDLHDLPFA